MIGRVEIENDDAGHFCPVVMGQRLMKQDWNIYAVLYHWRRTEEQEEDGSWQQDFTLY